LGKIILERGVKMQKKGAGRVLVFVIAVLSIGLLVGCSDMKLRPEGRPGYLLYPSALVKAGQALDEARMEGKDKSCPAAFNAAKDMVDKAYATYMSCRTQDAKDMAQEALARIKALCPPGSPAVIKQGKIILEDIHFDFDMATLTGEAKDILGKNIKAIKDNPGIRIQIEGHACAHGTESHNMALSEARANAVKEYLVKAGISSDRLTTIAYGETRLLVPEVPTEDNKQSKGDKANRRVHFEVIMK
jgi:outer membrane protein OmpA-like peptidoglycan-associated protein